MEPSSHAPCRAIAVVRCSAKPAGVWWPTAGWDSAVLWSVTHLPLLERVRHLSSYKLGVEPPDVLTLALTAPHVSVNDALFAESLSDLDLDTVAVLAVPPAGNLRRQPGP